MALTGHGKGVQGTTGQIRIGSIFPMSIHTDLHKGICLLTFAGDKETVKLFANILLAKRIAARLQYINLTFC